MQVVGGPQATRVYNPNGLARTLLSKSGGLGGKTGLYAVGLDYKDGIKGKLNTAYTLLASDYKGLNRRNTQNAVFEETPTGDTLRIKAANHRGYQDARPGDSVCTGFAGSNKKRGRVCNAVAHTLDTGCTQGVVAPHGRIRRLMPRECFRLQGFSEAQIDKLLKNSSDTQAYKQAGNAVTVNVVHALGLRLKAAHEANVAATRAERDAA